MAKNFKIILTASVITVVLFVAVTWLIMHNNDNTASPTSNVSQNNETGRQNAQLANPASVYCQQQGGKLEIRTDANGGQIGYCLFADGKECEEWAYFRGECSDK